MPVTPIPDILVPTSRWGCGGGGAGRILRDEPADEIIRTDSHSPLFERTMKNLTLTKCVMFPVWGICLGCASVAHFGKYLDVSSTD